MISPRSLFQFLGDLATAARFARVRREEVAKTLAYFEAPIPFTPTDPLRAERVLDAANTFIFDHPKLQTREGFAEVCAAWLRMKSEVDS